MNAFKVMTFNIRGATFEDGSNNWLERADLNVQTILNSDPDLIGFQEYQDGNQQVYDRQLTAYQYEKGAVYNREGRPMYNAIYWKRDRFSMVASGGFYYSLTPDAWSRSWDGARVRSLSWVTLEDIQTENTFHILNTHFDHKGQVARLESAKLIVERTADLFGDAPQILMGDFNSSTNQVGEQTVYHTLVAAGFLDSYVAERDGNVPHTIHMFRGKMFDPSVRSEDLRLDWILLRGGITASETAIIRDEAPPLYPSDHYPVTSMINYQ